MIFVTGYRITLPEAPSYNHYWRNTKGGSGYISKEGKAYKDLVALMCIKLRGELKLPYPDPSTVWGWSFEWYASRRIGDLDNRRKVLQDAIKGLFWVDDKQIVRDGAALAYDPTNPRMELHVQQLEMPHPFAKPEKKRRARAVASTPPKARSTS